MTGSASYTSPPLYKNVLASQEQTVNPKEQRRWHRFPLRAVTGWSPCARWELMMGDMNSIVVVPQAHVEEALHIAQEFFDTEERVKDAISQGVNPIAAHERVRYDQMTRRARQRRVAMAQRKRPLVLLIGSMYHSDGEALLAQHATVQALHSPTLEEIDQAVTSAAAAFDPLRVRSATAYTSPALPPHRAKSRALSRWRYWSGARVDSHY